MAAGAEAAGVILQQMELAGGGVRLSLPAGTVSDRLLNLKQTGAVRTGGKILGMEPEQRQEKSVKILVAPGKLQRLYITPSSKAIVIFPLAPHTM